MGHDIYCKTPCAICSLNCPDAPIDLTIEDHSVDICEIGDTRNTARLLAKKTAQLTAVREKVQECLDSASDDLTALEILEILDQKEGE